MNGLDYRWYSRYIDSSAITKILTVIPDTPRDPIKEYHLNAAATGE